MSDLDATTNWAYFLAHRPIWALSHVGFIKHLTYCFNFVFNVGLFEGRAFVSRSRSWN